MKLVLEIHWCVEYEASGIHTIPFEYSSIEDFQYMVLEKIKEYKEQQEEKNKGWYRNGYLTILGEDYNIGDLEDSIEHYVYELNDWFERNKVR